ncbi:MAG TPA: hypothetical protein VIV60_29920 [Polyangiaceae bacterium]
MVSIGRLALRQLTKSERHIERDPNKVVCGWKQLDAAIDAGDQALPIETNSRLHIEASPTIWGLNAGYVLSGICVLVATQLVADHRQNDEMRIPVDHSVTAAPWPNLVMPKLAERHPRLQLGDYSSPVSLVPSIAVSRQQSASIPKPGEGLASVKPQIQGTVEPEPSTFDAEFRLIRGAKHALDAGDPRVALGILEEHATQFRLGVFRTEREGLRVLSLCLIGTSTESRAEALRYLRGNRQVPMVDRVRRECKIED